MGRVCLSGGMTYREEPTMSTHQSDIRVTDYSGPRMGAYIGGTRVAEAVRYYKSEGSGFSGWVVRSVSDPYNYSDPISTRKEARLALCDLVAEIAAGTSR